MLRDMNSSLDVNESIRPQVAAGNVNGQGVDLRGSDAAVIAVSIGAITGSAADAVVTLEESVDNSTFTDVATADILGVEPTLAANTAYQFGYIGEARYVRAVFDLGGETNVAVAVTITRGMPHIAPTGAPRSNAAPTYTGT
jgi:hypothetical protein